MHEVLTMSIYLVYILLKHNSLAKDICEVREAKALVISIILRSDDGK